MVTIMSKARFSVTFEIVTQESAENGDAEERGYICEAEALRDALKDVHSTRTNEVEGCNGIECDSSPCVAPRWVTVSNGMEFRTGAYESRSLHIPQGVTPASARRIARLVGARV